MLERLSNLSSVACGTIAAAFIASAGALYFAQTTEASATPVDTSDRAVDLAAFQAEATGPVNLMVQINRAYQFPITDGNEGQAYLIPLFSAADNVDTTQVVAAVMVNDLVAFDQLLADKVIGNARMGDLYAVEGAMTDAGAYSASVDAAFEMANLTPAANFAVIAPTMPVAAAAGFGVPIMPMVWGFAALSLAVIAAGLFVSRRERRNTDALTDRFQRLQGVVIPAE